MGTSQEHTAPIGTVALWTFERDLAASPCYIPAGGENDAVTGREHGEDDVHDEREAVAADRAPDAPADRRRSASRQHRGPSSADEHRAVRAVHVADLSSDSRGDRC